MFDRSFALENASQTFGLQAMLALYVVATIMWFSSEIHQRISFYNKSDPEFCVGLFQRLPHPRWPRSQIARVAVLSTEYGPATNAGRLAR